MEHFLIPYEAEKQVESGIVLVFAPHPDDEVFGCGGAIIRHVAAGDPVHVVIVTDGGFQQQDGDENPDYAEVRKQESVAAAQVLGYGVPAFLGLPDRGLEYGEKLILQLQDEISKYESDLIYVPSIFEMHPDHQALGMSALEAVRRSEKPVKLFMYEIGVPLRPNLLLDISNISEQKQNAMACFKSQLKVQNYTDHIQALNRFRTYTLPKSVTAAEAYMVTSSKELGDDPLGIYSSELTRQAECGLQLDPKSMPLVTVIIRSISREVSLREALDSVALQTYPNIEVLVVNAKGQGHIKLDKWCGRFSLRMCGIGVSMSRSKAANFGLNNAKGAYLIFLDDDDLFDPDHIANLMDSLIKSEHCMLAYTGVQCKKLKESGIWEDFIVFNDPYDSVRLLSTNYIPIHAALFSRKLTDAGCAFDEQLDVCEDWDFWIQASRVTDFLHVNKVSAKYRISDNSSDIWLDNDVARKATLEVIKKWEKSLTDDERITIANSAGGLHQRSKQVELLQEAYDARSNQVIKLEKAYKTRGEQVERLQEAYDDRTEQVEHLEKIYQSPGKEIYINDLKKAYTDRTKQVNQLEEGYKARGEEVHQLRKAYHATKKQVRQLEAAFELRAKHIQHLETAYELRGTQLQDVKDISEKKDQ